MKSRIDPATGRNRREAGRLHARSREAHEAWLRGEQRPPSSGIIRRMGKPAESRAEWRRREKVSPARTRQQPGRTGGTEPWERGDDAMTMTWIPPEYR